MNNWFIKNIKGDFCQIAKGLKVSETTAKLIALKGLRSYEEARQFLYPQLEKLPDPFLIKDMDKAVYAAARHMAKGSKIAIYADYDVDGVMSAVILIKALNYEGTICYIPDRMS